ncbi:hypothetical protein, partial [Alienimonas sp. DA493]|uniref:hypothetical protein n=1 Tax=Alienimonas sp. DA493 TaxID=3373605 RepID=UPI003753F780
MATLTPVRRVVKPSAPVAEPSRGLSGAALRGTSPTRTVWPAGRTACLRTQVRYIVEYKVEQFVKENPAIPAAKATDLFSVTAAYRVAEFEGQDIPTELGVTVGGRQYRCELCGFEKRHALGENVA